MNKVCVAWGTVEGVLAGKINFLTYGDGTIRTYSPGHLDGRCGDPPVVKTVYEVSKHLRRNPDQPFQMSIHLAKELFDVQDNDFAQ